jgi:hypothetical protein
MRHWKFATLLTFAILGATGSAQAGLIPVQVSVTPDSGNFRYTYAVLLPSDAVLQPGDWFTIYNFDGLVPNSATASGGIESANWTFSTSMVGPTPPGVVPNDNPNIANLTWTYNGPVIGLDAASVGLGNFWADSLYPTTTQSWFAAHTGTLSGVPDNNITPTSVPVPTAPPPGAPEPATLFLVGLGLFFVFAFRRKPVTVGVRSA